MHLAVAIHAHSTTTRIDWRTDYDALTYEVIECPTDVAELAHTFLSAAGLTMATSIRHGPTQDHHRVLEIGTETGYNAALLCHRLGAANVYTNDIDPTLVDEARLALKSVCFRNGPLRAPDGEGWGEPDDQYRRITTIKRYEFQQSLPKCHPRHYLPAINSVVSSQLY